MISGIASHLWPSWASTKSVAGDIVFEAYSWAHSSVG